MDRPLAMALLKGLVNNDLVEPSYISIHQAKPNHFQIKIRSGYNKAQLEQYAKKYDLAITEDKKESI